MQKLSPAALAAARLTVASVLDALRGLQAVLDEEHGVTAVEAPAA